MVTVTSYRSLKTTIVYCRSLMSLLSHMSLYSANFPMCLVQVLGNELNRKKAILYLPPLKQQVARELQYKADYLHGLKTVGSQKNNAVNHVKKVQHLPMLISLYLLKKKMKVHESVFSVFGCPKCAFPCETGTLQACICCLLILLTSPDKPVVFLCLPKLLCQTKLEIAQDR